MTIDEALARGAGAKQVFLVWRSDDGAPLDVVCLDREVSPYDWGQHLNRLQTDWPGVNVAGRFFDADRFTRASLEELAVEAAATRTRVAGYNQLAVEPLPRLVERLERREYPPEVGAFHGAANVVEILMGVRRGELTPDLIERLRVWAGVPAHGTEQSLWANLRRKVTRPRSKPRSEPAARRTLSIYLALWDEDAATLKAMWARFLGRRSGMTLGDRIHLIRCFGILRVSDRAVVSDLIGVVRARESFEARYQAMIALGRIGPIVGIEAVQTIRTAFYDSSEPITELRERVCARIQSSEEAWHVCSACDRGLVPFVAYGMPSQKPCPKCLELGWVARDTPGDGCLIPVPSAA